MNRPALVLVLLLPALLAGGLVVDADGDGLATVEEFRAGTAVLGADTDGDGLADGAEVEGGTDPRLADTDGDGLADGEETARGFDPLAVDSDEDGIEDPAELDAGSDPLVADSDGDGLADGRERELGSDPLVADADGDGLDDAREVETGSDPTRADTDGDGLDDGREADLGTDATAADTDGDGLADDREIAGQTDPTLADSDADGLEDARELDLGTDPLDGDSDDDRLEDGIEADLETDPLDPDTDDDGFEDGPEVDRNDVLPGADPLRLDVYVEVDLVEGTDLPRSEVERVIEAYADAPVGVEGHRGIDLHVVFDETDLPERGPTSVTDRPASGEDEPARIRSYAEEHFDHRGYGYHYAVVVPEVLDVPGSEVIGEAGDGEFLIQSVERRDVRGSTFMHELAHSLGLDRNDFEGIDSEEYSVKEYPSVMNYDAGTRYYGYSAGDPFDDWSAIVEDMYVPERSRFVEDASADPRVAANASTSRAR